MYAITINELFFHGLRKLKKNLSLVRKMSIETTYLTYFLLFGYFLLIGANFKNNKSANMHQ